MFCLSGSKLSIPLIVAVVSGVSALILLLIVACVCYSRRRAHAKGGSTTVDFDTTVMPFRGRDMTTSINFDTEVKPSRGGDKIYNKLEKRVEF